MKFVSCEAEGDEKDGNEADQEVEEGDRQKSDDVVLLQADHCVTEQATDADTDQAQAQEEEEEEVYEPRAAYDYVDEDEEDDEIDSLASSPLERSASPGEWRRTGRPSSWVKIP